ncbi:MAG: M3 family metallopeptidase [Tepidiformaceae bacterium]
MSEVTPAGTVDFAALTPASLAAACESAIAACDAGVAALVVVPPAGRTHANTLLALEDALEPVRQASGQQAFMAYVAADDDLRETARQWDEKLDQYLVGLGFRDDLYEAIRAFAATPEAAALSGEDARFLEHELRDYRRRGFELPAGARARVRELFEQLVVLGNRFRNAIDDWEDGITVSREELAGLPDSYIEALTRSDEAGVTRYRVSLDYPEYHPFMANAAAEHLRRALFEKEQVKAGSENVRRLEEAIAIRAEIARLLGYDSWAAYTVEERMAKRRGDVDRFLADLRARVALKAAADIESLRAAKEADTGAQGPATDGQRALAIWDWRFYHNRLLKTDFAVDDFAVAKYFPLEACLEGLFSVTQELLGVRYREAPEAPRWHADVRAFDIFEAEGEAPEAPFARFYMDLFPRPNKYGHAAAFTLRSGRELPDGSYQSPVSAIVANFTKPAPERPSLLRHSEVETLFHEFGHILHQTLTRTRRASFSGTNTERDFVEAPSQMLEHWVWDASVLRGFSRHYETGEPLPEQLLQSMIAAKYLDSGVMALRQLLFATLDFAYHSPGFDGDTTKKLAELHDICGFPYTPGTHFQSGFGHLFGYDAGYYGYLWSNVFGDDMFTRFEAAGLLDSATGAEYRRTVLERGGSADGDAMVREFLGREPNSDAFLRGLGLEV